MPQLKRSEYTWLTSIKNIKLFISINNELCATELSKVSDMTNSHVIKLLNGFKKNNLIDYSINPKCRRQKIAYLTYNGEILKKNLKTIIHILNYDPKALIVRQG